MEDLTAVEKRLFNELSQTRNPDVHLGDLIQKLINDRTGSGTPVNAVAAVASASFTGDIVHGDTFTVDNPAVTGKDVYEFLADEDLTKSNPSNIAVDIVSKATVAAVELTMAAQPTSGDTVTVGEKTYIFVPVGTDTAPGEVSIGANLAGAQAALVAAINGTDSHNQPHPSVYIMDFAANIASIEALIRGSAGNAIVSTETFTSASNLFSAATLTSGTDCSATDAVTALIAAITASDTQGISASDRTGGVMDIEAKVAGVCGNAIGLATTSSNVSILDDEVTDPTTHLLGGIDGTVSDGLRLLVDSTNLYVCIAANTTADANWRYISLGDL